MSISLTEVAFNLVRKIAEVRLPSPTTGEDVLPIASFISINGPWSTETNANDALVAEGLMSHGAIASIYDNDDDSLPNDRPDLVSYCTRIAKLEGTTIDLALKADYKDFKEFTGDPEYQDFEKGLKTLKERLDSTIKNSADNLVNTVASYVKVQYDTMTTELPVNVTEAEVQTIAAGIAEKFAEDFAAKIQEKLTEITNDS